MKSKTRIVLFAAISLFMVACNPNEIYENELYKKVICIVSNDDLVFEVEHDLSAESSIGYISVSCGGTNAIDHDITVEIEDDPSILAEYNRIKYDLDSLRFARKLDSSFYKINEMSTVLKSGDIDAYSKIEIQVKPNGLSPDSIYLIPLRIKNVSQFDVNPDKQRVLYRVLIKNDYAQQKTTTYYRLKGSRQEEGSGVAANITADKVFYPVSKKKVRTLVGTTAFQQKQASLSEIDEAGIFLIVNEDNTVSIEACGSADVEMLGGAQDNYYSIVKGVQTFHLYYRYWGYSETYKRFMWITMRETCTRQK